MDQTLVTCSHLSKRYGTKAALDDVNLRIDRGHIIGLLGPNGSGKTTLIKLINGLLSPTGGEVLIDGEKPGPYTRSIVSYLPDKMYFADWMRIEDLFDFFEDFYEDFERGRAEWMCQLLDIHPQDKMKKLSKGNKEKVQLILVMSRRAELYLLDEPIAGVDPAARDYILDTIINNYNEQGTIIISTHLIADIEKILDQVIFIRDGHIIDHAYVDDLREENGMSIDQQFREMFHASPYHGHGQYPDVQDGEPYVQGTWRYPDGQDGDPYNQKPGNTHQNDDNY